MGYTGRGRLRAGLRWAATGAAAGWLLGGVVLLVVAAANAGAVAAYLSSPMCTRPSAVIAGSCFLDIDATVVSAGETVDANGAPRRWVTLGDFSTAALGLPGLGEQTHSVATPNTYFFSLRAGEHVQMRIWNNRAVGVRSVGNAAVMGGGSRFVDSPAEQGAVIPAAAVVLLCAGAVMLLVLWPLPLHRGRSSAWMGRSTDGGRGRFIAGVFGDVALRATFAAAVAAQVADISTSIAGTYAHLYEVSAVNEALLVSFGALGFLPAKVIFSIGVLTLMGRLPRRLALGVGWFAALAFVVVAATNLAEAGVL